VQRNGWWEDQCLLTSQSSEQSFLKNPLFHVEITKTNKSQSFSNSKTSFQYISTFTHWNLLKLSRCNNHSTLNIFCNHYALFSSRSYNDVSFACEISIVFSLES
jgi:hypothetical protein